MFGRIKRVISGAFEKLGSFFKGNEPVNEHPMATITTVEGDDKWQMIIQEKVFVYHKPLDFEEPCQDPAVGRVQGGEIFNLQTESNQTHNRNSGNNIESDESNNQNER